MNKSNLINFIKPDKKLLRNHFKQIRKKTFDYLEIHPEEKLNFQKNIEKNLFEIIEKHSKDLDKIKIACYFPIKEEINCLDILLKFKLFYETQGKLFTICLPKTHHEERALTFYEYKENFLVKGKYNIKEPDSINCKEIIPYFILTPLLAFDSYKHRLGYGKGHFDNTFLKFIKYNWEFISIGIAYEELLYDGTLPVDNYDQNLNYVVTQTKIINEN